VSAKSQLIGAGINAYLNARRAKHALHTAGRVLGAGRRSARLYYRADDPYSHLMVQVAPRLAETYGLTIELVPIAAPSAAANPQPAMLLRHAISDAALLGESYGLSFPKDADPPSEDRVRRAHAVLLGQRSSEDRIQIALELGEAIWRNDAATVAEIVNRCGSLSGESVTPALEANYAALERAGHYQPGMLYYGGEWYWGIDRLHYLEERLQREGLEGSLGLTPGPNRSLAAMMAPSHRAKLCVEVFVSFRSPYSYLAIAQLIDLRDRHRVDVTVRPVLPMVMRGLPISRAKKLYIVHDAKREADRLGIPFGRACDPLGKGIAHCMALFFHCAVGKGLDLELCGSLMQGIWSEARDVAHIPDLLFLAKRVGIDEAEVRAAIADPSWKEPARHNREALTELGLWGVPCLRIGSYSTWGQDRIPLVEAEIARISSPS
jgi:2-hydroxychromene-2-carboxylate isomerase